MKRIYLTSSITAFFLVAFFLSATAQQAKPYEVESQTVHKYKDFRFAIGGGYAYRLGKSEKTGDTGLDNLNKNLRHGFTVDADAQYFFKETWGLGLNANFYSSSTSGENVNIPDFDSPMNVKLTQSYIYMGPSLVARQETNNFMLLSSVGFGPIIFNEDSNMSGRNIVGKKTTLGMNVEISGEYKVSSKTGVGLKLSYINGTIQDINIEGQNHELDNISSLSNLMATLFVSFKSW